MPSSSTRRQLQRRLGRALEACMFAGLATVAFPNLAHAYVDPVSGSVLLQVLAAGLLAALFTVKRWWLAVTALVRGVWSRLLGR